MKRVLVVSWSQTGQLDAVVRAVLGPLQVAPGIEVVVETLQPVDPYPFPWPFLQFFDTFPETVLEQPRPLRPLVVDPAGEFDLVILAYQVWFLTPAQPMLAFLQSAEAARLLRGKQVMTLVVCRNMWLMAQDVMKGYLDRLGAILVDNAALVDRAHPAATFISTPLWMLTGRRGPFLGVLVPAAGIPAGDIAAAARFGTAIASQLPGRLPGDSHPMLRGLQAVQINERLIASEKMARRSFQAWGKGLRALGPAGTPRRRVMLRAYIVFLVVMILTVVPVSALLKRLLTPLMRKRVMAQRHAYAQPSGED